MIHYKYLYIYLIFHSIGPLGRFGLVVAMSVCVFIYLYVPFPCDFFRSGGGGGVLGEIRQGTVLGKIRQGRVLGKVRHGAKVY